MIAVADTSVFIARESGRPADHERIPDRLRISTITVGELRNGVLSATSPEITAKRLGTYVDALELTPIAIDRDIADRWGQLRIALRDAGRTMPVNDSWIAATALHLGLAVVTQDDDYDGCPELTVIKV